MNLLFVLLQVDDENIVVDMVVDKLVVHDKLFVDKLVVGQHRVHLDRE